MPVANTPADARRAARAGASPTETHLFPDGGHGFGLRLARGQIASNTGPICSSPGAASTESMAMIARAARLCCSCCFAAPRRAAQSRAEIERTMRRATELHGRAGRDQRRLCLVLSARHVAPLGRDRGASPSMIWVQPPGTATMGHLFLDAYHATGDEYYYRAAASGGRRADRAASTAAAAGIISSTSPARRRRGTGTRRSAATPGGWRNSSIIGDNAHVRRRRHVGGDAAPAAPLSREARARNIGAPLDRAIGFVLDSQYPNGGWPQRWPHDPRLSRPMPRYITFNDDVAAENIRFLLMVYQSLGEARVHRCDRPRR